MESAGFTGARSAPRLERLELRRLALVDDELARGADLAEAEARDPLLVVVRLESGEVVGRPRARRVEHVERIDHDETDLGFLGEIAVFRDEIVPGSALVVLTFEDVDVLEDLL